MKPTKRDPYCNQSAVPVAPSKRSPFAGFVGTWTVTVRQEQFRNQWNEETEELVLNENGSFRLLLNLKDMDMYDGLFETTKLNCTGNFEVVGLQKIVQDQIIRNLEKKGFENHQALDNCFVKIRELCGIELRLKARVPVEHTWNIYKKTIMLDVVAFIPLQYLPAGEQEMKGSVVTLWKAAVDAKTKEAKADHDLKEDIDLLAHNLFIMIDETGRDFVFVKDVPKILPFLEERKGPVKAVLQVVELIPDASGGYKQEAADWIRIEIEGGDQKRADLQTEIIEIDAFCEDMREPLEVWARESRADFEKCRLDARTEGNRIRKEHQRRRPDAYIDPWDIDHIRFGDGRY